MAKFVPQKYKEHDFDGGAIGTPFAPEILSRAETVEPHLVGFSGQNFEDSGLGRWKYSAHGQAGGAFIQTAPFLNGFPFLFSTSVTSRTEPQSR